MNNRINAEKIKLDYEKWERKNTYELFSSYTIPTFQITTKIDLYEFPSFVKTNGLKFYPSFAHCCLKAMYSIPQFFVKVIDKELYECNTLFSGFAVLDDSESLQFIGGIPYNENIFAYNQMYDEHKIHVLTNPDDYYSQLDSNLLPTVFFTCIPWISFQSVINPIRNSCDDNLRLCWGKYYYEKNKATIDVSVQAHHGLVDGIHICRFFNHLQKIIKTFHSSEA